MRDQRLSAGLDDNGQTRNATRKRKRCFHRVISGLERGGELRFLTLTSAPGSPADIQRSWRRLIMRLKRRGLVTGYIKVTETNAKGLRHLHVLVRGSFIAQAYLSKLWSEIHQAPVVDIRRTYGRSVKVAGYLAKYMSKAGERYSWDWSWVYRGLAATWAKCRHRILDVPKRYHWQGMRFLLFAWKHHVSKLTPPDALYAMVDTLVYNCWQYDRSGGDLRPISAF